MSHFVEIHVNGVSRMIYFTSLECKHNCLTFIYPVYYLTTHLPLAAESSLTSQNLPSTTLHD